MKNIALITGITGQDGHHLTKLLLAKGYSVTGIVNGQRNSREDSFMKLFPDVKLIQGDLSEMVSALIEYDQAEKLAEIDE